MKDHSKMQIRKLAIRIGCFRKKSDFAMLILHC
jgi:hypothetical protein